MKFLSLKLKEEIFDETEAMIKKIHTSRNAYINKALELYNKINQRKLLRKRLEKESRAAQASSLEILNEMEKLEDNLRP